MKISKILQLVILAMILVFVFFEVSFPLDIAPAAEARVPDPTIEAEFERCYAERDREVHRTAFSTIDNPDVQKEFISTNRERIAGECRKSNPERLITVQEPSRFNLVDLNPRFW